MSKVYYQVKKKQKNNLSYVEKRKTYKYTEKKVGGKTQTVNSHYL